MLYGQYMVSMWWVCCLCVWSACPAGLYGAFCESKCDCAHGSTCDAVYGQCLCQPGYHGPRCDTGETLQVSISYLSNAPDTLIHLHTYTEQHAARHSSVAAHLSQVRWLQYRWGAAVYLTEVYVEIYVGCLHVCVRVSSTSLVVSLTVSLCTRLCVCVYVYVCLCVSMCCWSLRWELHSSMSMWHTARLWSSQWWVQVPCCDYRRPLSTAYVASLLHVIVIVETFLSRPSSKTHLHRPHYSQDWRVFGVWVIFLQLHHNTPS